ncbi:arylsulfatase [Bacteroidota bacterium]
MIHQINPCLILGFLITVFTISCSEISDEDNDAHPPNIILIMTDDQGHGDLGFHGNPDIKTPTLDSLAKISTRFTQFYVSPVCAPTRASLMTGRYSIRTGVYDTYNGGAIMSDSELTIPERLKEKGYVSGVFGKWHLGDSYPFRPQDQGFDHSFVHSGGGIGQPGDYYENYIRPHDSYFDPVMRRNGDKVKTSGYCSDVFTEEMLEFIDNNKENPFFAYLAFNAPHTPLQVPENYYEMYSDLDINKMNYPEVGEFPEMNERNIEDARKVYGMVTNIDDNIKKIFDKLEISGLTKNTLLIFITDNGPQQPRYVSGFRGRKGSVYEGGIRVPSFWYWQGVTKQDYEIITPSAHFDIVPTLMDICGLDLETSNNLDGKSLWPLLKGESVDWIERPIISHWTRGFTEPYHNVAVRKGSFKLVGHGDYRMAEDDFELFNMDENPYETVDISDQFPDMVTDLKQEFDDWYDDVMQSPNHVPLRIQVGSEFENPVVLNRNDTKGPMAKRWTSPTALGYWDILVAEEGLYDIKTVYFEKFRSRGRASILTGNTQRTIVNQDTSVNSIQFENIELKKGDAMFQAWYEDYGRIMAPILVEIKKK